MKQDSENHDVTSYTAGVLRYAITDSGLFGTGFTTRRDGLVVQTQRCVEAGVNYIQLREKDLEAGALLKIAEDLLAITSGSRTKLLINARADVAVATGADGVHLTSHPDELIPEQVRQIFALAHRATPVVSVSCHTILEVERACASGADLILFGPVFEKRVRDEAVAGGEGLDALRRASQAAGKIPVLALGGVTPSNTADCLRAGAAGVAGIRLFANDTNA